MPSSVVAATAQNRRVDLAGASVGELLALSREILAELRRRGVIRSGNAPAATTLNCSCRGRLPGTLASPAQQSYAHRGA